MLASGQIIAGRFALEREAGAGGMATVFRARDLTSGNLVALKLLTGADPRDLERFAREAGVLAEMAHPGIVGYLAHGATTGGQAYLAMELLEGENLGSRLTRGPLAIGEAVAALKRVADALSHAHQRGVIHRDIKPDNLFLPDGDVTRIKILDFGIARLTAGARLTQTGALVGTPAYMAPEIIKGVKDIGPAADIFALGCVIFECLTGQSPFQGDNVAAILAKVLRGQSPPLKELAPQVPKVLADLIAAMMARRPEDRPHEAQLIGQALAAMTEIQDVAVAPGRPPYEPRLGLTRREQRIACVLMARDVGELGVGAADELTACGVQVRHRADQLLVAILPDAAKATDQVLGMARAALVLLRHHPQAAIALCTGPGEFSDHMPGGDVVDEAARLVLEVAAGNIRVDAMGAGLLDGHFDVLPTASGAFLRSAGRAIERKRNLLGRPALFVGRARELGLLTNTFATVTTEDLACSVLVIAQAGAGKSRLRQEFLDWVQARPETVEVLYGTGDSLGTRSPFALLGQALLRAAGIATDDGVEERQNKLRARVGRHVNAADRARVVAYLGELSGVTFPESYDPTLRAARQNPQLMGDGLRRAWEDWLAAECAAHPVLLVLEDLQWSDSGSVSFVDSALRQIRNAPFMLLASARPEVETVFPNLWSGREVQVIRLGPLSRKAAEALIRDSLGAAATAEVLADLVSRADGNAFFLEELVRAIHEGRHDGLPDSVLGMVQARLDSEPAAARRVLRAASVFGERFSEPAVRALLGGLEPLDEVSSWLRHLKERELIDAVSPVVVPLLLPNTVGANATASSAATPLAEAQFSFTHALIRESAYSMLTPGDQVLGHRLAAAWLAETAFPDPMVIAEHFRRGEQPGRAVPWYLQAAVHALGANDLAIAIQRAALGLEALAAVPDLPDALRAAGGLRLVQAEAHLWRGELAVAAEAATAATRDLEPGSALWLRAAAKGIIAAGKQGRLDQVETWLGRVTEVSPERGARVELATALAWGSVFLVFGGRYALADELMAMVGDLSGGDHDVDLQALALLHQARAVRASTCGDLGECLQFLELALAAFEQAGDVRNACTARANTAFVYAELGDTRRAEQVLREALDAATRMGLSDVKAIVLHNLGRVVGLGGDLVEAENLERQALAMLEGQGEPRLAGLARTYLAEILIDARKPDQAAEQAELAVAGLEVAPGLRARALAALSAARAAQGRTGEAQEAAARAYAELQSQGTVEEGESEIRLRFAESLFDADRVEEGRRAIADARTRLHERAQKIVDLIWRDRFLCQVRANARTLALATDRLAA